VKRRSRAASTGLEEPLINLTPLIDVVFVVLIMFIVVARLVEFEEVDLAQGAGHESVQREHEHRIVITVKADDSVTVNKHHVGLNELPGYLSRVYEQYPNERPLLVHDKSAKFGTYQMVKNAAQDAGFGELDLVLSPS
jgi:biopolymer transport protein ExbD